jgi:hypothetical protein
MDFISLFRSVLSKLIQLQQPSKLRASDAAYNLAFAASIGEQCFWRPYGSHSTLSFAAWLHMSSLNGGKLIDLYHCLPRFPVVVIGIIFIASVSIIKLFIDVVMLSPLLIDYGLAEVATN